MANVKVFRNVGQRSRSRSQDKKIWHDQEGLMTRGGRGGGSVGRRKIQGGGGLPTSSLGT